MYSYISDLLNIDIYIMRVTDKDLYLHLGTNQPGKERRSIIIAGNGYHFETIGIFNGNLIQTFFEPNNEFVQKIRSFSH